MTITLESPRWRDFQESLARIVRLSMGVLDADGEVLTLFNAPPELLAAIEAHGVLQEQYVGFRKRCVVPGQGDSWVVTDPLGLKYVCLPQENGQFIILGGALDSDSQGAGHRLLGQLKEHGVDDAKQLLALLPRLTEPQLKKEAENLRATYRHVVGSARQTGELGARTLLLAGVQEINRLMVRMLNPSEFDLGRILDLIASSLLILLDAEGAWAFAAYHGRTAGAHRGMRQAVLQHLLDLWKSGDQNSALDGIRTGPVELDDGQGQLDTATLANDTVRISLGLVNSSSSYKQAALDTFIEQVAIAVEIAALYESLRKQLGTLLDSLRHGVVMVSQDSRMLALNRAAREFLEACGLKASIGKPVRELGFPFTMANALQDAARLGEACLERQDSLDYGSHAPIHLKWDAVPIRTPDGLIEGAVLVFEDTTEVVRMRQRMNDWERLSAAGEVAAGLAHEIRNPLGVADGILQLLEVVTDEQQRSRLLSRLGRELQRMNRILADFLSLARPEAMQELGPVDLDCLVEDLVQLLNGMARLNNVDLVVRGLTEGTPVAFGDSDGLKQVFLNLAKNAVEAMPGGGTLEISVVHDGTSVGVRFADDGPGIPEEVRDSVLRPFFTTKLTGTGLGLSVSSSLVEHI